MRFLKDLKRFKTDFRDFYQQEEREKERDSLCLRLQKKEKEKLKYLSFDAPSLTYAWDPNIVIDAI
jgi:hypothetical protein